MFGDSSLFDNRRKIAPSASSGRDNREPGSNEERPVLPEGMQIDIAQIWRLLLKHKLVILGTLAGALVLAAIVTLLTTPIYTAATTLQIDRESARVLGNVEDVSPQESAAQGEEFFQTQYGLLRSRSLAQRVIQTLRLDQSDDFLNTMGVALPDGEPNSPARIAERRQRVLKTVQTNLGVAPVRGSRLVVVSFNSPDPALAARIVNAFSEGFIQANLDLKFQSTAYAREFLEEQLAQTKAKLEDAERQLVAYASDQQIINVTEPTEGAESTSLAVTDLTAVNAALTEARTARVAAQEKWAQAQRASPLSLQEVIDNPTIQALSEERAKLAAEYQQKLSVYRPEFPEMEQTRNRLSEIDRQVATLAGAIRTSIQNQYIAAANQENTLARQVNRLKGDVLDFRDRSIEYNIIKREVDTSRTLYDALLQRYKEVSVTAGVAANNVSIVDPAEPPQRPSKPQLLINLALAAILGLGLGMVVALLMEALDETLASPEDVESKLGLPVLGMVPLLDKDTSPALALKDVRSPFAEAYYSLRTALQFSTPHGVPASLLLTSSRPGEGKSTTAYALAMNLAAVGRRVLLADGDLRNPSLHRVVGLENEAGMSNVLSGAELEGFVVKTSHPGLDFIPCGPLPPNPAELWGGDGMRRVLEQAMATYDHVIIDGPPVLGFADAPLLASVVGGTVFVLESRRTRRAQARGALRRLAMGNSHILGAVLTKFNSKSTPYGGYDYAYDYAYGSTADAAARKPRKTW